jgi:uncharacterized caspase-like protein/peptidoglycan hydrolase-like protein with peptidoglycan-binding domain
MKTGASNLGALRLGAFVLAILSVLLGATPAEAAKRVALVLGNGAYAHAPGLANPVRDARAMAAALERLGFEVELGVDLDLAGMRRAVQAYARGLQEAEVALFYYAGHGLQVNGQNYLLPVDAEVKSEVDLDFSAMPARLVLDQMERWPAVKIVMLDACRDNPFETALSRSMGSTRAARALSRGLAPIEAAGGTLLAYATDPGDVAADGSGDNSPFTDALLKHVETPGVEIHTMLARVRADVFQATGHQQRPWTESSLIGEFYLAPAEEKPPVTSAMLAPPETHAPPPSSEFDPRAIELAVWDAAQTGGTAEDYREYLRQYPDGIFAKLARNRLAALSAPGAPESDALSPETAEPEGAPETAEPETGGPEAGPETATPDATEPEGAPDGVAPPEELAEDPAEDAARLAKAAEAALGLDGAKRREVQARLMLAGHDPRGVDGVFGPGTRAALAAWQAAAGLEATGYLGAAALDLLTRRTETDYAAWVEQQRAAEAARAEAARARAERQAERDAAQRARAERRAARDAASGTATGAAPGPTRDAAAAEVQPPAVAAPEPEVARDNPLAAPAGGRSHRERYRKDCYFVLNGTTEPTRICN